MKFQILNIPQISPF